MTPYLHHFYAVVSITLTALYIPHWWAPTGIAVVYALDLSTALFRHAQDPTDNDATTPISQATTLRLDESTDSPTGPPTPPDAPPAAAARQLQHTLELPPDAAITVDGDDDNPWNDALQTLREQDASEPETFSGDSTAVYDGVDPSVLDAQHTDDTVDADKTQTYDDRFDPEDFHNPNGDDR